MKPLIKPPALRPGDRIGVFTPSAASHVNAREKYLQGLAVLRRMGFDVVEGPLTARAASDGAAAAQGYRAGTPEERAAEMMALIRDPSVKALIATVGGAISASLIPYLDFDEIRAHPKIICGYSDITSLHMAVLKHAGLSTFYGPAVASSFGEWPDVLEETRESFLDAAMRHRSGTRELRAPRRWSNHKRPWETGTWKTEPRKFEENPGWRALRAGEAEAQVVVANLSTLLTSAGTSYFPDVGGKILLVESMAAPWSVLERNYRHLERLGVFDAISGLIVGKSEFPDPEGAPFSDDELLLEILETGGRRRPYPVITGFDCAHTHPMLTIAELTRIRASARAGYESSVTVLEPMVS